MSQDYDSHEIDALTDLERSDGYGVLRARVEQQISKYTLALTHQDQPHPQMCILQGQIRALRLVLELPESLKKEIAAKLATKKE